jgi:hypothetical protein
MSTSRGRDQRKVDSKQPLPIPEGKEFARCRLLFPVDGSGFSVTIRSNDIAMHVVGSAGSDTSTGLRPRETRLIHICDRSGFNASVSDISTFQKQQYP